MGDVVLGDADLEVLDDLAVDLVGDLPGLLHDGDLVRILDHPHRRYDVRGQRELTLGLQFSEQEARLGPRPVVD